MENAQKSGFEIHNITLDEINAAYENIAPYIEKTPVIESKAINKEFGKRFFFKCENMQTTGSFKIRGALNATLQYVANNENCAKGLVTHSSGNHGVAVAMAAKMKGLKCAVVTPNTTPGYKLDAIKSLGAELVLCEQTMESRIKTCHDFKEKYGYHYISSCDDYDVITGQFASGLAYVAIAIVAICDVRFLMKRSPGLPHRGVMVLCFPILLLQTQATLGLEFLDQVPDLDAILVTVSGGGMAAGSCLATRYVKPECKVFTAEPPGKYLEKCLRSEKRLWPSPPQYLDTVAEGLRVQQIGHRNWPILLDNLQRDVFTVEDEDTVRGLQYAFKYLKVVLEPSAGTAVAAALSEKMRNMKHLRNIGVVLCGGNVDLHKLPEFLKGVQDITL